eukprot:1058092-Alexandrium_andersonii.AAC.1
MKDIFTSIQDAEKFMLLRTRYILKTTADALQDKAIGGIKTNALLEATSSTETVTMLSIADA